MTSPNVESILEVLNSLDVIETNGGEDAYILVENNEENREVLNEVGISNEVINRYGDEETFCILALAFSEGYCDLYDGEKLIKFDRSFEVEMDEEKSIILFEHKKEYYLAISENNGRVSTVKLQESQLNHLRNFITSL